MAGAPKLDPFIFLLTAGSQTPGDRFVLFLPSKMPFDF
jgi:hypothetical protein